MEDDDKKFNIEVGNDGVIYLSLAGKLEGLNLVALQHWSREVHKVVKDRYENTYAPVKVVINIAGVTSYAPEAVTILTQLLVEDKNFVHRSATFGGTGYILMAQDMLTSLSGRTNFKAFDKVEDAVAYVEATS